MGKGRPTTWKQYPDAQGAEPQVSYSIEIPYVQESQTDRSMANKECGQGDAIYCITKGGPKLFMVYWGIGRLVDLGR